MARKPSNPLIDEQIMDQAFSELAALVEESEGLLNSGRCSRSVRRQFERALQRATALANQLGERTEPAVRGTEEYVRAQPLKALGIAAAVGAVAAFAFNRR